MGLACNHEPALGGKAGILLPVEIALGAVVDVDVVRESFSQL
jgi:hypothetical protein